MQVTGLFFSTIYFNELDPQKLGTVDMVRHIVPILKREGFTFARVDQVPEIAALLPPPLSAAPDSGASTPPPERAGAPAQEAQTPEPKIERNPCP